MKENSVPATAAPTALKRGAAVAGTGMLVVLTRLIGQQSSENLATYALYQAAALITVTAIRLCIPTPLPRIGDLAAPARRIRALGVREGESWARVGVTFTVIISIVTAIFLAVTYGAQLAIVSPAAWGIALLAAVPLSTSNALVEETISRWAVVAAMPGTWAAAAPWVSAILFGSVHWFGIPGGPFGAVMAGFLGWLLIRSVQDTRGIGWAWIVHFCQDMLIFTTTIAVFAQPASRPRWRNAPSAGRPGRLAGSA